MKAKKTVDLSDTEDFTEKRSLQLRSHRGRKIGKGLRNWLVSSFEGPIVKKERTPKNSGELPWTEKYRPGNRTDLTVHSRKVKEVSTWLEEDTNRRRGNGSGGSVLLLTGPPGCGKAATVHVLAKEMKLFIKEWINPLDLRSYDSIDDEQRDYVPFYESQSRRFENFLFRSSKYNLLTLTSDSEATSSKSKILLVKELPNVYLSRPASFHHLLRRYHRVGCCPVIFVVSEGTAENRITWKLFPDSLQRELGIGCIRFNPVTHANLVKALLRIASAELPKTSVNKKDVEDIANSCDGDIRSGVNTMQLLLSVHMRERSFSARLKEENKCIDALTSSSVGNKDSPLLLFRALGKFFYCKRDVSGSLPDYEQLPLSLSDCVRFPLQFNPEEIVEQTPTSIQSFALYLHQNYLDFIEGLSEQEDVITCFSDADILLGQWESRTELEPYASCIASRGVLFSCHPSESSSSRKWRPLYSPTYLEAAKQVTKNSFHEHFYHNSRLLEGHLRQRNEVLTEVIPFLGKIAVPCEYQSLVVSLHSFFDFNEAGFRKSSSLVEKTSTAAAAALSELTDFSAEQQTSKADAQLKLQSNLEEMPSAATDTTDIIIETFDDDSDG